MSSAPGVQAPVCDEEEVWCSWPPGWFPGWGQTSSPTVKEISSSSLLADASVKELSQIRESAAFFVSEGERSDMTVETLGNG